MDYPRFIEIDGKQFALDTDYRTAIKCFEVIQDGSIDDYERSLAVIYLLLNDIPDVDLNKTMELLQKYLSCGQQAVMKQVGVQRDMDIIHDEKYIIASFMSDYHIDLSNIEGMHWWHFINLLDGLTGECILNKVREIRTSDLKDYKGKSREKMAKAKEQLALPVQIDDEDRKALEAFDALFVTNENKLDEGDYLIEGGE